MFLYFNARHYVNYHFLKVFITNYFILVSRSSVVQYLHELGDSTHIKCLDVLSYSKHREHYLNIKLISVDQILDYNKDIHCNT